MFKNISVIIVNWNSNELVQKQLEAISPLVSEIIIVDNNSTISFLEKIKKYKNVQLIQNKHNKGYAAACNQGLVVTTTEWVLFLNPDVTITNQTLRDFLVCVEEKKFDAVSIQSNSPDYSKPVPSLLSLVTEFSILRKIIPLKLFKQKTLIGGILFANTEIFKKIGGWDERFFLWFEDSDLTIRLLNAGYKIGFCDTKIEHIGGYSLKKLNRNLQNDLFFTAMKIYSEKHFSIFSKNIVYNIAKRFSKLRLLPSVNTNLTSIVVPNMRQELLDTFLENNIRFFSSTTELIIVSSALTHQNIWSYRKKYPEVRFILIETNKGFAHTVNIGFKSASGTYIGTCNDDVILEHNWLMKLLEHSDEKTGSLNPIIVDNNNKIESAGIKIDNKGKAYPLFDLQKKESWKVDATNGACVVYSKAALLRVGIFDERFGSYLEDIDLSLRLKRAQFDNIVVKTVTVVHSKHQTSNNINFNKSYHDFKNWILVIMKNWSVIQLFAFFPQIILERARNISGMIKNNKK